MGENGKVAVAITPNSNISTENRNIN